MASKTVKHFDFQAFLTSVGTGKSIVRYQLAQPIFRQGDTADAVFYIEKGKIQITVLSEQGKEGIIAILESGAFFGEACLAGQPLHLATAVAMTVCDIIRIEKDTMMRKLREDPAFSQLFMSFLPSRNIQIESDLVDQLFNSSEKRLARVLMLLAHYGKEKTMEPIVPKINHDTLAARVGTTRSRVNYFMNKFRKLGFIEYNGDLKVHSSLLNVIVHD